MSNIIILGAARSFCQPGQRNDQQDSRFPDYDTPREGERSFVVCDGVGGEADGAIASSTVAKAFGEFMAGYADPAYVFTIHDFQDALNFAYHKLMKVVGQSRSHMATTLTFLHFNADNAIVAHMGDSRVYQIRPKVGIMYRTSDHSLVNAMVHAGTITPEEAIDHPKSNVITRCMTYTEPGAIPSAADMITITDVAPGDYFLLCTDGVLHQIDDQYLLDLFSSDISDDEKIHSLAEISKDSTDNNTAIFVRVTDAPQSASINGDTTLNEEIEPVAPANPCVYASSGEQYQQEYPQHDEYTQHDEYPQQQEYTQPDASCAGQYDDYPGISTPRTRTAPLDTPQPAITQVTPDNSLPFFKRLSTRIRDLFS